MDRDRAQLAAENNARWCDAVCRAHGLPCEFVADAWLTRGRPPPFYSNMVTMRGGASAAAQARLIREIIAADPLRAFGFKDSFCRIDLAALSPVRPIEVYFEATWVWLDPRRFSSDPTALNWSRVTDDAELRLWERTWRGDSANAAAAAADSETRSTVRQFPPLLLANPEIAFLAGRTTDERIRAVAIANRTGAVVGLSNVFGPGVPAAETWRGAVAAAFDATGRSLPLVGYERGAALQSALALGFEPVGPLRVCGVAEEP